MSQIDIQAYLDLHGQLTEAIKGLTKEELHWKQKAESWSVTEVLTHLLDHHIVVSFRIRDVLAGTTVQLPAFNQDQWVNGQKGNQSDSEDILETYRSLLQYNAKLFGRLAPEELEKTAINHKGDTVRVIDIAAGFIKHVHHHLGQIERIKQAQAAKSVG
ncbi:DinB family protein [uncultured Brevibacillus sp.]|uniref:DinB family protein n=1 Tax=uncultured Brevibacillus sp. TaxID=169970 RepID=UPI0025995474|nr:DinB family protein [uncultured Brevibacillus sp.]